VDALAPLAGENPRAQKRLRNLFRFLHPAPDATPGLATALALFLAADIGATPSDRQALEQALSANQDIFAPKGSAVLQDTLAKVAAIGGPISRDEAWRAATLARHVAMELFA
jgi:hypothetical protein